jgi:hypothetical protein
MENNSENNKDILSIQNEIVLYVIERFNSKIEELFKIGLERKGFTFKSEIELKHFIIKNCKKTTGFDGTTYYVNNIPFFYYVSSECGFGNIFKDDKYALEFNGGHYAYL